MKSISAQIRTPDTPRIAMGLLERRVTAGVVALLVALAAIAWVLTILQSHATSGMISGLGQVGSGMPNMVAAPLFLAMWLTMMVAMMFPTIAPMVLAHRMVVLKRGEGCLPTAGFLLGYLIVWTAIGLVLLLVFLGIRNLSARPEWLPAVSGAVLLGAGLYQFTGWKRKCLRACRTPLGFILDHNFGGGVRSAFGAGISHGAYCLGCCWAMMAVLVVVGVMNLVWMAALALLFLLEKNWRHGVLLTKLAGTGVAVLGLAVILHPELLTWIFGGPPPSAMGGSM